MPEIVLQPRLIATTATANGPLVAGYHTPVDATTGNRTMTLPTPPNVGASVSVEKIDAGTNTVVISGNIRGGAATITLRDQYQTLIFEWFGTTWRPTADHRTSTSIDAAIDTKIATQATADAGAYETQTHASATYVARVTTISALKTLAVTGLVRVHGYYSDSDGGGGNFRWDSTDTTSTDNGGTIIQSTVTALASTGRWKRIYDGAIDARWFGVSTSQADNTAALQAAVTWVGTDISRQQGGSTSTGGEVHIPFGSYKFLFTNGTSGLSTITIANNNVLITGEGRGTLLNASSTGTRLGYFFTFTQAGVRGQGGGVRDIAFEGRANANWFIFLDTWRAANFSDIWGLDIYGGIIDACSNQTAYGEDIRVHRINYIPSGSMTAVIQYAVRFRAGTVGTWTDCSIRDVLAVTCWDCAVILDGCQRINVTNVQGAFSGSSGNTIDGTTRTGCLHAVSITNTVTNSSTTDTGYHIIDGAYLESHFGTEDNTNYNVVWIDSPAGQIASHYTSQIVLRDLTHSTSPGVGLLKVTNNSGIAKLVREIRLEGFRNYYMAANDIQIGTNVLNTSIRDNGDIGNRLAILDSGTNTRVNGERNWQYSTTAQATPPAPTVSGNANGAGSSFTGLSAAGIDRGFLVTLTTGTAVGGTTLQPNSLIFVATFGTPWQSFPSGSSITPQNAAAANVGVHIDPTARSATALSVRTGGTALQPSTQYRWFIQTTP